MIKFNWNGWRKPYIDVDTGLRKIAKNDFEKDFFSNLMYNAVFGKTMENVRKHRDIKLVTTERRKNYYVVRTKLWYFKVFHRKLITNRHEKTEIFINKPVYLGLSILELSKILIYEFWHNYVKPKYDKKTKLCFMDADKVRWIRQKKSWQNLLD